MKTVLNALTDDFDDEDFSGEPLEYTPIFEDMTERYEPPVADGDLFISGEGSREILDTFSIIDIQQSSTVRLRMVEYTLLEIKKHLDTVLGIIREERARATGESYPPLLNDQDIPYDILSQNENKIPEELKGPFRVAFKREEYQEQVYQGVFTGEMMRTRDGYEFLVPPNYASKSRLVQGDILLLRILSDGRQVYKQIGPAKRKRTRGILEQDPLNLLYTVSCPEGRLRVLPASISYYKGVPGDKVTCMIPVRGPYQWGAIEGIVK